MVAAVRKIATATNNVGMLTESVPQGFPALSGPGFATTPEFGVAAGRIAHPCTALLRYLE